MDCLFSVLSRLHGRKQKCSFFLLNEGSRNVNTFRYCCLGLLIVGLLLIVDCYFQIFFIILSGIEPTIYLPI